MALLFGYRAARALAWTMVQMQLGRAVRKNDEVLNIPILLGPVGTGKTSIGRHIAGELGYAMVKINCGESADPTEVSGLPVPWRIKEEAGKPPYMEWVLNQSMHEACERPVLLFFDDIDKAQPLVEGALLGIFGERRVRDRMLHPETVIIAAGNRVENDVLARRLSESLRTRATIINIEPRLGDFEYFIAEHQRQNPDMPTIVHPAVTGFLRYRPAQLHSHDPEADRFPTPRGWVEVSEYLHRYEPTDDITESKKKGPGAWQVMIGLKCGEAVAADFWSWYSIVSKIDVKKLLTQGMLTYELSKDETDFTANYAAVFAVAQELNRRGVKKEYQGLVKYVKALDPELRVALLTQLSKTARNQVAKALPAIADVLLSDIVALGE